MIQYTINIQNKLNHFIPLRKNIFLKNNINLTFLYICA